MDKVKEFHTDRLLARTRDSILILLGTAYLISITGTFLARFTQIILLLALAVVVAYVLNPLVSLLQKKIPRGWAIALVYLLLLGIIGLVGYWLITQLIVQTTELITHLSDYNQVLQKAPSLHRFGLDIDLNRIQASVLKYFRTGGTRVATDALNIARQVTDSVVNFILVIVLSIYLMIDARRIRSGIRRLAPVEYRDQVDFFEEAINKVLGGYIRGQLLMSLIIGVLAGVGSFVLGVQYPLIIGILAFFFELIPMLGPVLSALPAVILSLFQPFPLVIWVILYFTVVQLIESNVLGPRITGHAVGIHPIVSIIALLVGSTVAGLWGALFAVPVAGLLQLMVVAVIAEVRGQDPRQVVESEQEQKNHSERLSPVPLVTNPPLRQEKESQKDHQSESPRPVPTTRNYATTPSQVAKEAPAGSGEFPPLRDPPGQGMEEREKEESPLL